MMINRIFEARDQAERLRLDLIELQKSEQGSYKAELQKHIEQIQECLEASEVPEYFKIAVVGTFKTGKSSFVNKLAEERLAGVETNPETAAISIFRHADTPRAEVQLLGLEEWVRMEELYEDAPKHPEAYRVAGLQSFNAEMEKRKDKDGNPIKFDPIDTDKMVKQWLKNGGNTHVIEAENWDTRAGKQAFRKSIREFTAGKNPLHYFVDKLTVYAPVPLLREHVELIDTPGLNDTQLYRGQLTEKLLSEVDAILFLTRSGASFSQYDKEFIVRQLRKKRLRHLRLVVTKVDETYESARRDAMEEDEDPPTFEEVRAKEEVRIRHEIERTLNELLDETGLKDEDGLYYLEQLEGLKIHFTSAVWFDEGRLEESGIPEVKEALFEVLSENYHLAQLVDHLERTVQAIRRRLRSFFNERLSVMDSEFDPAKVEKSMEEIERQLHSQLDGFQLGMQELLDSHSDSQEALQELMEAKIATMLSVSREVLSEYEKRDVSKHWKTRRHGYWGYLSELGGRVADKVFPIMESSLNRQLSPFHDFLDLASGRLESLAGEFVKLESDSAVDGLPKIEFSDANERFIKAYRQDLEEAVSQEKNGIIELLEGFAEGELQEKLEGARQDVKGVLGTGTTVRQSSIVESFYGNISQSVADALKSFLEKRLGAFSSSLNKKAGSLFPKLRAAIESQLVSRRQAIADQLLLQSGEAREQAEDYLHHAIAVLEGRESVGLPQTIAPDDQLSEQEISIPEDATGYSYESLFAPYLFAAETIEMKEPYLRFRYQLDNFQSFCELVARIGKATSIELVTGDLDGEDKNQSDGYLENVKRNLKDRGVEMNWSRSNTLHAREIKTNDGWRLISDRGLDIYKKPASRNEFGHFDQALRRCKQTEVQIRRVL